MTLTTFVEDFQLRYQDILGKSMVGMKIANLELKSSLSYGDKVHRFKLDLSGVVVRDVTPLADQTIDAIADSDQTLDVDQKKGAAFAISDWEKIQAGPLSPGLVAGKEVALKVRRYIDADILFQVTNADYIFDTGNLTTSSANGTPVDLGTLTNVPIMVTRVAATLQKNNVPEGDWCFVLDPEAIAQIAQHAIGKDIDMAGNILKNGYSGPLFGFEIYMSNNLTGQGIMVLDTTPTDGDTVVIGDATQSVTFTFKTALTPTAGEVLIGGSADAARLNLSRAINATGTPGTDYVELSAANRKIITHVLRMTATDTASTNTLVVIGKGSGRLVLTETLTAAGDIWDFNFVHAFAGKRGSIDAVVQMDPTPELRQEPKQKTVNVLVDALYGIKAFDDGQATMIDLWIKA